MDFDLSCDLGEGEPSSECEEIMSCVTSANIACGGHAGDVTTMRHAIDLALRHAVRIGAHPGTVDRDGFGRSAAALTPAEFAALVFGQIRALEAVAHSRDARLTHVKLHGALYHLTEQNPQLASIFVESIQRWWPSLVIVAQAQGRVLALAKERGVEAWGEAFLDRSYLNDGSLAPRTDPGALLISMAAIEARIAGLLRNGEIRSREGRALYLTPRTLCFHSDSSEAPRIARLASTMLFSRSLTTPDPIPTLNAP